MSNCKPINRKQMARAKVSIPNLNFNVNSLEDYTKCVQGDGIRTTIIDAAIEHIKRAVIEKKDKVDIFRLHNTETVATLNKDQWRPVIKNAIKHFSRLKKYERCIDCQQLLEVI